ncbi:MAG: DUF1559 domain-containing protein [Planctomycetota bacterium]
MHSNRFSLRSGLSTRELLVVIACIAVILAIVFPWAQAVRESARRNTCMSEIRTHVLSILRYEAAHMSYPRAANLPSANANALKDFPDEVYYSWKASAHRFRFSCCTVQPEFEKAARWNRSVTRTVNGPNSASAFAELKSDFLPRCPSEVGGVGGNPYRPVMLNGKLELIPTSSYVAANNIGACYAFNDSSGELPQGIFRMAKTKETDIADGLSATVAIAERRLNAGHFTPGAALGLATYTFGDATDYKVRGLQDVCFSAAGGINQTNSSFPGLERHGVSSNHPGGVCISKLDGSCHFLSNDIDRYTPTGSTLEPPPTGEYGVWESMIDIDDGSQTE